MNVNTLYFLSFNLLLELNAVFAIIHVSVLIVDAEHWKKMPVSGKLSYIYRVLFMIVPLDNDTYC